MSIYSLYIYSIYIYSVYMYSIYIYIYVAYLHIVYVAGTKWVHLEALAWVFSATSAFRVGLRKPVVCTL